MNEPVVIDLEKSFIMYTSDQVAELQKCFNNLNNLIKTKNSIKKDVLWVKVDEGEVRVGYEQNPKSNMSGMHQDVRLEHDMITNIAALQFVIFEALRDWNLYEDVPMKGAPEEGKDSYFVYTFNDTVISPGYTELVG